MCNLYNVTTTQQAILEWSRALHDLSGNLEPSMDVYLDFMAPIVRNGLDGVRELVRVRWGMPSSSQALFMATESRPSSVPAKGGCAEFHPPGDGARS